MGTIGRILGGVATVLLLTSSCSLLQPTPHVEPSPDVTSASPEPAEPKLSQAAWDTAVEGMAEAGGEHAVWMGVAEWATSGEYVIAAAFPGSGLGQLEWQWVDSDGEVRESIALGAGGEITTLITDFTYEQARQFLDDVGECGTGQIRMWAARPMPSGSWQEYGGCAAENRVAQDRGATPGLYNVVPTPQRVLLGGEPLPDLEDWTSPEALTQLWSDGQAAMGDALLGAISISPSRGGATFVGSNGEGCGPQTGFVFIRSLTPSQAQSDLRPGNGGMQASCTQAPNRGFQFSDASPDEVARIAAEAITEHGLDIDARSGFLAIGLDGAALVMQIGQEPASSHTYVLIPDPAATPTPSEPGS